MSNADAIQKRRIFGIISHPDAGKTTLTEKLLLHGGAIREAGTVKARGKNKFAKSDWMEIEKQRGISVTSSVMQFEYDDKVVSIMDTPGHNDFGEDTYRILTSVDSAVTVSYTHLRTHKADDIRIPQTGVGNFLLFRNAFNRGNFIPQCRRPFKFHISRCRQHFLLHFLHDSMVLSFQTIHSILDIDLIFLRGNPSAAWRNALPDMVIQARTFLPDIPRKYPVSYTHLRRYNALFSLPPWHPIRRH